MTQLSTYTGMKINQTGSSVRTRPRKRQVIKNRVDAETAASQNAGAIWRVRVLQPTIAAGILIPITIAGMALISVWRGSECRRIKWGASHGINTNRR